jgi:hypothetical protein
MLIFAKDIGQRDPVCAREATDPGFKEYMEYQRGLFPYTLVRAGLDLAYKELDDVLDYVENNHRPLTGSGRTDYPADVPAWFRGRFPWTAAFLDMADMHDLLVHLIRAMDSFRSWETLNTYHWVVLYDVVCNVAATYNVLLETSPDRARDIRLSHGSPVNFDDFVNNYWAHLDFMLLSRPDFPHARLMERNRQIEAAVREQLGEGDAPLMALERLAERFGIEASTLALFARQPIEERFKSPVRLSPGEDPFAHLHKEMPEDYAYGRIPLIEAEYERNYGFFRIPAGDAS